MFPFNLLDAATASKQTTASAAGEGLAVLAAVTRGDDTYNRCCAVVLVMKTAFLIPSLNSGFCSCSCMCFLVGLANDSKSCTAACSTSALKLSARTSHSCC
jgi:hypothetical protein